ncbi:hypothetical protein M011DRAFT_473079 [Sporormia fimetaria CBS 119925]|uniref:Uncharacterized protein n=1 Tax=Sporormia fimetaria CBS 119925 TaxID=1340428 RepID=A0A6A6VPP2_9PLEO|nr:hypothetical protein M011DRAFT_473079 [Sporormia fimetaria CBS 119925]
MSSTQVPQRGTGYESDQSSDTAAEDEIPIFPGVPTNNVPAMWQSPRQQSGSAVSRLSQKFSGNVQITEITPPSTRTRSQQDRHRVDQSLDDDSHSRTSTLGKDDQDFEFPEKTPTSLPKKTTPIDDIHLASSNPEPPSSPEPPHIPGPLETQLMALMSKLIFMERANPTVSITPEDYNALTTELASLRAEKATWNKRHEALFALRDEDVENNIKIRGLLAKARRDLEAMTKLRDDDLSNLLLVRGKLAEATRKLEKLEAVQPAQGGSVAGGGRASPVSRHGRPGSVIMERRGTMDLFTAAKTAALEQRALELEQRNMELLGRIERLKGGAGSGTADTGSSIDELNRVAAHKAWKGTVSELEEKVRAKDREIEKLRAVGGGVGSEGGRGVEWQRVEVLFDDFASYRERMGAKMQALRGEKEGLVRELNRREDDCHALEVKVQSLQRRVGLL